MLDPIKSALILPEVTDATKWWEGKQKYADKEGQYIFVYEGNVSAGAGASYNSQLLDPREYKSYWDLLNPKLKGKILSTDIRRVRGAGIPWQFLYYSSDLGSEISPPPVRRDGRHFNRRSSSGHRLARHGEIPVGMPIQGGTVYKAKNQGLPVDEFSPYHFKEGVNLSSAFGSIALMNRAPHPNAAKVFINWLLSRDGQTLFQKSDHRARRRAQLAPSGRAERSYSGRRAAPRQDELLRHRRSGHQRSESSDEATGRNLGGEEVANVN